MGTLRDRSLRGQRAAPQIEVGDSHPPSPGTRGRHVPHRHSETGPACYPAAATGSAGTDPPGPPGSRRARRLTLDGTRTPWHQRCQRHFPEENTAKGAGLSALPPGPLSPSSGCRVPAGFRGDPAAAWRFEGVAAGCTDGRFVKATRLWLSRVPIAPASRGLLAVLWLNRTRCHPGVPVQHRPHGHRVLVFVAGSAPSASPSAAQRSPHLLNSLGITAHHLLKGCCQG